MQDMQENKNRSWLRAAGVRALKTVAQTALATVGTAAVLDEVNWMAALATAALAGLLSLLTSIAGLPEVGNGNDEKVPDGEKK